MVKGVKGLKTQLESTAASFAEDEVLEERQVPVVTPWAVDCIVAEGTPVADGRGR